VFEVSIPVGGGAVLAATLSVPDRVPAPVIIGVHGASGGTRDHPLLSDLHPLLPPAGFGVLTFDRRGEGASTGEPSVGDFETQAEDVREVASWLRALPSTATAGAFGFSQGAWVAPLALRRAHLGFLILVAACGVTPAAQMRFGVSAHLRRAGYDEQAVEQASAARKLVEAHAHDQVAGEEVANALAAAALRPWWELAYLPEKPFDEHERAEWCREMDFDPEPSIAAVNVPTLLLYGTDDLWLPVDESLATWRRHHEDVSVLLIQGASHGLSRNGQTAPEVYDAVLTWLAQLPVHSDIPRGP